MKQTKTHAVEIGIFHRLFLRFLLCYAAAFAAGWLWCVRISSIPATGNALLFLLLALLGGFLSVSSPFLLLLTGWKAVLEAQLLYRLLLLARADEITLLSLNACLLLLLITLFVYVTAAASACRFSHETYIRDLRLLLSGSCLAYLVRGACLAAATLLLKQLWSYPSAGFPL